MSEKDNKITFKLHADLESDIHSLDPLKFKIKETGSFNIKINSLVESEKGFWKNIYTVKLNKLDVGYTQYFVNQLTGVIRSRSVNKCPTIIIKDIKEARKLLKFPLLPFLTSRLIS